MTKTFDIKLHINVHDGKITSSFLDSCIDQETGLETGSEILKVCTENNRTIIEPRIDKDIMYQYSAGV